MKITVSQLPPGQPVHLTAEVTPAVLPADAGQAALTAPVRIQADVYQSEGELTAVIEAETVVAADCSRCLAPVPVPLAVRFTEVLRPAGTGAGDDQVAEHSGDEVDLLPAVMEHLALALPMKPLCREDCRGLCPVCGSDRNEKDCDCGDSGPDPRLARLGELWDRNRSVRKEVD